MTEKNTGWRVSSYSGSHGNCVEVGQAGAAIVVRDTKNRESAALRVSPSAWRRFAQVLGTEGDATIRSE